MDEELINQTIEDSVDVDVGEVIEGEVRVEDLEQSIETEETIDIVEIETIEEINIEMDEAIGWVGGDSTRHYSLYGRDEADQHPITAITGLREELNDIEALDVVYSNERNQANYYLWEDGNVLQEDRVGYFVSADSDINEIKLCTSDNDIFGVTVDSAGFIGAQADIPRDIKYGLVVTTGIVHVRCESSVNIGDYVVSNDYGYAQSNKNGYRVVGRHQIDGVEYAEITLVAPINRICKLSSDIEDYGQRMDEAETNIVAAINMANAAYNKAGEATSVSEEVLKNALEALKKSEDTKAEVDKFLDETTPDINETWEQARAIAESAAASAITAKDEAVATANEAWAKSEDVSQGFQSLTAKIDQYSVGEYSQAYGLTLEQARSILKAGMIYVPTKHLDGSSHSETYLYIGEDGSQQKITYNFTPGNHYEWDGTNWMEYGNTVAFFSEEPTPSRVLTYWYIDSNEAPEGYEAHTLYVWDEEWQKVNILEGNVSNRMTSMIRQTTDKISAEITNARGGYTGLDMRLDNTDAQLQLATFWNNPDSNKSNLAAMQLDSSDDGSSLALVVMNKDGEQVVNGANIVLGADGEDSYIQFDADVINFTAEDYQVIAENINLTGYVTIESLKGEGTTEINGSNITTGVIQSKNYIVNDTGMKIDLENGYLDSAHFKVNSDGEMIATSGEIAGWNIEESALSRNDKNLYFGTNNDATLNWDNSTSIPVALKLSDNFGVNTDGKLWARGAEISGIINASAGGTIGGWNIGADKLWRFGGATGEVARGIGLAATDYAGSPAFWAGYTGKGEHPWGHTANGGTGSWTNYTKFYVTNEGHLHASMGSFDREITIAGRPISSWMTNNGYINEIAATKGSIGGWSISNAATIYTGVNSSVTKPAIYIEGNSSEDIDGVYLTTSGVYVYDRTEGYYDYASWRKIIASANK